MLLLIFLFILLILLYRFGDFENVDYSNTDGLEVYTDEELKNLSDKEILTRAIWGEARGSSRKEKGLVGQTILNRVNSNKYPNNITDVILQDKQFSPFNSPKSNKDNSYKVRKKDLNELDSFQECQEVADEVLQGKFDYMPSDVLHFIAVNPNRISDDGEKITRSYAAWAVNSDIYYKENHYFLRGV